MSEEEKKSAGGNVGIYALLCPQSGETMYIGQSINIKKRFASHLQSGSKYPVSVWISGLKEKGLRPGLKVLVECDRASLDGEEIKAIAEHKGKLLNVSHGGKMGYADLSREKPWSVKGVSHPTKMLSLLIRNRKPNSALIEEISRDVKACATDEQRCKLELRYAEYLSTTPARAKVEKWASAAIPKMREAGYA